MVYRQPAPEISISDATSDFMNRWLALNIRLAREGLPEITFGTAREYFGSWLEGRMSVAEAFEVERAKHTPPPPADVWPFPCALAVECFTDEPEFGTIRVPNAASFFTDDERGNGLPIDMTEDRLAFVSRAINAYVKAGGK